ncbi:hypothetical protein DFP94_101520 [Fontibacillus phaseoli]|uniref:DNA methylase n=1 Tax=Fontibacillus phaseoli TaxID=1416533 RepID=A0A369BNG4_9BACL|nr:site-specific DNA-methyltransferase [Fontibacillus phaseoli]RCX22931.1 hypothetical protein DFP94_101520 [Fontibacillus phaseoli]
MTEINTVICGDSAEVLRQYPDNFFDSVVCDPSYGLSKEPEYAEIARSRVGIDAELEVAARLTMELRSTVSNRRDRVMSRRMLRSVRGAGEKFTPATK